MTKRTQKKLRASLEGIYEPKPAVLPAPESGHLYHALDLDGPHDARGKVWPTARDSEVVKAALIWIDAALARARISADGDADDEVDLRGLCRDAGLTDRQTEVLCSVAEGFTQAQVAVFIGVEPPTVQVHLRRARLKLAGIWPLRLDEVADVM